MKRTYFAFISGLILCCGFARADVVDIAFLQPSLTGAPGDVLTFIGTLDNTTSSGVFLNADNFSLGGFDPSVIDDSPFFDNTPTGFLGPNGTTGNIGLFNIAIPNGFAPGSYDLTFQILGGATADDQTIVGSANFEVQVATALAPEPGSGILLVSILLVLVTLGKRSRVFARRRGRAEVTLA